MEVKIAAAGRNVQIRRLVYYYIPEEEITYICVSKMGKGSNVQKAQAARERNQKKMGKSAEERKAASAKASQDANAFMCQICRQTFMVNARVSSYRTL